MCTLLWATGCTRQESADGPPSSTTVAEPDASDKDASAPSETSVSASSDEDAPSVEPGSDTETPAQSSQEKLSSEVTLGDPSLTLGIPGEGPLSTDEIKNWLATEGVHDTLDITLPQGLDQAAQSITGIEENPLTRAKIELGRQLYFDPRLSSDSTISCATCHDPDQGYTARTQFGVGIAGQQGDRNSPVAYNRILSGPQFWDGRAESLEEQAKGPIANPIEMGNEHAVAVETIANIEGYDLQFDAIFGEDSVNIDNIAAAIASFERVIVTGPSPYDYHAAITPFLALEEDDLEEMKMDDPDLYERYEILKAATAANPMSESAVRGQELFFSEKANCTACHAGANFTDEKYHNLGVGMEAEEPDQGRAVVTGEDKDIGAFKTPTVRNVSFSAPYMHDGSQKTLEEVVEWYAKGGHPNPHLSEKIKKLDLTDQDKADLVAFMEALTGPFPEVETGRLPE
ncbi:MAG: cytochrome-c peroxidase [Planctomycetota bacterium]|nr:MAG: cytochrome-c peroxidase [Planctomycetota bacterium]REK34020.1 MAG: cytochrome-c peroxidase [Planctomycetota bacterium]